MQISLNLPNKDKIIALDLIIRDIHKSDIDSISEILDIYRKHKGFDTQYYDNYDLIKEILSRDKYVKLFIAVIESEVVGFILFNQSFDITGRSIFIEDNFVLEKYRNKKIGSSLFSKVLGYALENDIEKIKWSLSKNEDNYLKVYKEIGAKVLQDTKTYSLTKKQLNQIANQKIDFNSDLFKIRSINNRDLPQIKYFIEEENGLKKESDIQVDIYDLMKYSLGDDQLFKILLLEVNNDIVGLMTYFDYFSVFYGKSSHIQSTFVKEEYKSIGVGKILNSYLINHLNKNNYNHLTIDVAKEDKEAKERMKSLDATLLEDTTILEINNDSLRDLINI